jgi:hypothetical protein
MRQRRFFLAGAFAISLLASAPVFAQDVTLSTNASGITIGGVKPSWSTGFGTVNGLGLGTPGANETILAPSGGNGVLYTSPYNIVVTSSTGHATVVRAYVSTNFTHSAILSVYSCTTSCTSGSSYTALSTSSGSPTDIIPSPGLAPQTVTRYLGVFVSNQNGAAAFTGSDSATITVLVYDGSNNSLKKTYTLALNNPNETVQTALRLTLATASGGRTISTASDFSLAFGNVNALGISPGSGITVAGVSGGELYGTPYLLKPLFSSFSSTTGTLKAYVSTDFGHPSQLELRDSSSGVTYSALSKSSGSQTLLTSSASSGSTVTRYVGLFVSNTNGGSVFTGADNATVTFTLVVP